MADPAITVFTLPKMNDPNRVRPAVPKSPRTAIAAWQHVQFSSRLTSFLFYVWCPVSWSSGFKPERVEWKGKRRRGGAESGEACNSLKHHASFLSEGLCWLPSRWFTGPWRSRFVLLPETGFLDSASRHSAGEREKKKSISTSRLICYRLYLSWRKKKNEKISPMWGHADFSTCWIYFQQQQITPQRPFEQLSTWLKYQKKRGELNYKHVNCQTTLPDDLERFETLRNSPPPPTTSTFSN